MQKARKIIRLFRHTRIVKGYGKGNAAKGVQEMFNQRRPRSSGNTHRSESHDLYRRQLDFS